jgi:hypothetical protein
MAIGILKATGVIASEGTDDAFGLQSEAVAMEPHCPLEIVNAKRDEAHSRTQ